MTYYFGERSRANLDSSHPDLVAVFDRVIKNVDCAVLESVRVLERQQQLFAAGLSELDGINDISKHQIGYMRNGIIVLKADADDVIPYPEEKHDISIWDDPFRFTLFAGEVLATGWEVGVELIWGGDWDRDGSTVNQNFHDLPHFERVIQ